MPEVTDDAPTVVPIEHTQCERCAEEMPDGCVCRDCENCGESFFYEDAETCCEDYCSYRCAERNDHYHCECGEAQRDSVRTCSDCGRGECCREFSCASASCYLCERCCTCSSDDTEEADAPSAYIRHSSCRTYPASNPTRAPYTPFLFSGVELELECEDRAERDQVAADLQVHAHQILLKEDGSLSCGFEIVTGKNSLEAQQALWPLVAAVARKSGARSWKHSSTGLHVHLSRNWFSPLTLGKFLVFLNSSCTNVPIITLAGRECPNYAAIKAKKLTDGRNTSNGRYEAVNLTNAATIEVRIFKGTLNTKHILADIEFCYAAAYWASQVSATECESWENFWAYVLAHKKDYKHLIDFFASHLIGKES